MKPALKASLHTALQDWLNTVFKDPKLFTDGLCPETLPTHMTNAVAAVYDIAFESSVYTHDQEPIQSQ